MPNTEKFIGLVKWFHDKARNANYGFIQHAKLGELFFHECGIDQGQDIESFRENAIVVFVAQESRKHKEKLEAVGVKHLDTETDLNFLFSHFLSILTERGKYADYNIIQKGVHLKITSLLEKYNDAKITEQFLKYFQDYINEQRNSKLIKDEEYIRGLLKVARGFFPDNYNQISYSIEKKVSMKLAHKLWLESFIENCQIDYVAKIVLSETEQEQRRILNRMSEDDKINIFFKIIYTLDKIDTEAKFKRVKQLINLSKALASEVHEKILTEAIKNCPDYFKLSLWLEDYHQTLDFHAYKLYTVTLSPEDQKRFVKKVLKYIHEGKANISVEDLTSLNVIDFETSKLAEQIDNSKLDYSTSIILNVISELRAQMNIKSRKDIRETQHRIYDIIIKQIREPNDILEITGFFDACGGRCDVSVEEIFNEAGEISDRTVTYHRNEYNIAKNHPICDGRKAVNRTTKEPVLSDEKVEFWWCANQKCFKPSRQLHSPEEWENYSLLDFLKILKVEFKESDLEIYLNIINKANRFLKHLNCRKCNHILYPKGKSQYAFYGVNRFACPTEECSEKGKEIYLSHCLNGYCEMEIDSRDCVKCKPNGLDPESCGWYVCNYCNSCCSSEQLHRRKWVYENVRHSVYRCHLEGHRDLGVVSCNKCGDPMEENDSDFEKYNEILNWFIENRNTSTRIHRSGKNRRDKWWFTLKRGNDSEGDFKLILSRYRQIGFRIPDFEIEKELQLISEPIDFEKHSNDILTCKTCGNILDLSNDLEKARAIKKFHNVRFISVKVE